MKPSTHFLLATILLLTALLPLGPPARAATPLTAVVLDLDGIHKWDESCGDTWDPFWADDGNLYAFNCDGRGFGAAGQGRNLAFNELQGDSVNTLAGRMVNTMDEYGRDTQTGPDGATWKALGQECIDGVFYAFVSRHVYGAPAAQMRQTAANASLIKSVDRGRTWTRPAPENYDHPMWPGRRFGAPYFVHFGQNGGHVTQDGADQYVYAVSNNGFWCNGDDYVLGRVPRAKLPALNAADWTYYVGKDAHGVPQWAPDLQKASPLLSLPEHCGSGGPTFIPSLGTYLMTVWYSAERLPSWFNPKEMKYDFYQAPHPWGPWTFVSSFSDHVLNPGDGSSAAYGPTLCPKFQTRAGDDVRVALFTSGCQFSDSPGSLYKMWTIPLILKTKPLPKTVLINDDAPAITYAGPWSHMEKRGWDDYGDDVHGTQEPGASAELTFTGTGVDYLTEKNADHGPVGIYLDGVFQRTVTLKNVNFPRLARVTVYGVRGLRRGRHTLKIVNAGSDYAIVDAFSVLP